MKPIFTALLLAVASMTAAAADVTGKWTGNITRDDANPVSAMLILKQSGTAVTGTAGPDEERQWAIEKGKIDGNNVMIEGRDANGNLFKLALALTGDQLKGAIERSQDGETMQAKIEVTRAK
jgi:hypothetical protein